MRLEIGLDRMQLVVEQALGDDLDGCLKREETVDDNISVADDPHHVVCWVIQWVVKHQHDAADHDQYLDNIFEDLAWMAPQPFILWWNASPCGIIGFER